MKLDRNTEGRGKYALVRLRGLSDDVIKAKVVDELVSGHVVEFGSAGDENEFFVVKLKDVCAQAALLAYAGKAAEFDVEYANEVLDLARRAGPDSPWCKRPD